MPLYCADSFCSCSLQLIPIQKNVLLGFAKKNKFLAVPEVRPNSTSCLDQIYKGFPKCIKGKKFRHFIFILFFNIFLLESNQQV